MKRSELRQMIKEEIQKLTEVKVGDKVKISLKKTEDPFAVAFNGKIGKIIKKGQKPNWWTVKLDKSVKVPTGNESQDDFHFADLKKLKEEIQKLNEVTSKDGKTKLKVKGLYPGDEDYGKTLLNNMHDVLQDAKTEIADYDIVEVEFKLKRN